jgi:hypothetical protein
LLGSQSGVEKVVAIPSQVVLSLYLLPLPKPNQDSDKDVVFLELVVHILCPVLDMVKHQESQEEVVNSHHLAHCLLLYQPSHKGPLQDLREDFPVPVFRNLFQLLQVLNNSASEEGVVNFRRVSHMVLLSREILRRWA